MMAKIIFHNHISEKHPLSGRKRSKFHLSPLLQTRQQLLDKRKNDIQNHKQEGGVVEIKQSQKKETLFLVFKDASGELHSNYGPAIEASEGDEVWYAFGKRHRDGDKPAVIRTDGTKIWYKNGDVHRQGDQPAEISSEGQRWVQNGLLHRENNKPAIIYADGSQSWYQQGRLHRDNDQPALIKSDGTKRWYKDGRCGRDSDKPAVIRSDGSKEYWENGILIRKENVE